MEIRENKKKFRQLKQWGICTSDFLTAGMSRKLKQGEESWWVSKLTWVTLYLESYWVIWSCMESLRIAWVSVWYGKNMETKRGKFRWLKRRKGSLIHVESRDENKGWEEEGALRRQSQERRWTQSAEVAAFAGGDFIWRRLSSMGEGRCDMYERGELWWW